MKQIFDIYFTLVKHLHLTVNQIDEMPFYEVQNLYDRVIELKHDGGYELLR